MRGLVKTLSKPLIVSLLQLNGSKNHYLVWLRHSDIAVNRPDPHGSILNYITSYLLVSQSVLCSEVLLYLSLNMVLHVQNACKHLCTKGMTSKDKVSVCANWCGNARNKNLL